MKYLISVIVPTYNFGDSLHGLMESLKKQSFQNFEVIVVDGLSNDHSIETAKAYQSYQKSAEDYGRKPVGESGPYAGV